MATEKQVNARGAHRREPVAAKPQSRRPSSDRPAARKPKLGQTFLRDHSAGILTGLIAPSAERLVAIEIDRVLAAQLRMKLSSRPTVEFIEADVLDVNFQSLLGPRPGPQPGIQPQQTVGGKAQVIGNLP